jgi:hypothetical protein
MYVIEMASYGMIYLSDFMKISMGVEAILRVCLRKLKHYSVGITDGWNLRSAPLRLAQVRLYIYIYIYIHTKFCKGSKVDREGCTYEHTDTQTAW